MTASPLSRLTVGYRTAVGLCACTAFIGLGLAMVRAVASPADVLPALAIDGDMSWLVVISLMPAGIGLWLVLRGYLGRDPAAGGQRLGHRSLATRQAIRVLPGSRFVTGGVLLLVCGFSAFSIGTGVMRQANSLVSAVAASATLLGTATLASWLVCVACGMGPRPGPAAESPPLDGVPADPTKRAKLGKMLGVASVVLQFLGLGFAGLGLALIARTISRDAGAENKPATAGIWLGAINAAIALIVVVVLIVVFLAGLHQCQQLGPGDHQIGWWTLTCR